MKATWFLRAAIVGAMTPLALSAQSSTTSANVPWVKVSVAQTATPTVSVSASPGSYVVVVRVSNDLKAHIVYPASPTAQRPFPEGPGSFLIPLDVPKYSMGGVYAAASDIPFNFTKIAEGNAWDEDALILQASRDAQHAANRVLGMITPLAASVASAEAVYMGSETAKHGDAFANAVSLYLPVSLAYATADQCSMILNRYECGRNDPGSRGSPYLGCMTVGLPATQVYFCGTVHDLFDVMAGQLPARALLTPFSDPTSTCRNTVCSLQAEFSSGTPQWHPSADYSLPAPAPAPMPSSPTPLPAPVNPPANPLTIPPTG